MILFSFNELSNDVDCRSLVSNNFLFGYDNIKRSYFNERVYLRDSLDHIFKRIQNC